MDISSGNNTLPNRAFLFGDAVKCFFFVRHSKLIMMEECYFFLMASMRKMRFNIPLSYTLEYFISIFSQKIEELSVNHGIIHFMVYREHTELPLQKAAVSFWMDVVEVEDVLSLQRPLLVDMIKEINVNDNLLSNIHVHCPENIYGQIYATENDLDELILLNPNKRIARSISGNFIFLVDQTLKIIKTTEGAYISPLLENLITFIHKNRLLEIQPSEMIAFETQKAEEILIVSDEKGLYPVEKIRNKTFTHHRFSEIIDKWKNQF